MTCCVTSHAVGHVTCARVDNIRWRRRRDGSESKLRKLPTSRRVVGRRRARYGPIHRRTVDFRFSVFTGSRWKSPMPTEKTKNRAASSSRCTSGPVSMRRVALYSCRDPGRNRLRQSWNSTGRRSVNENSWSSANYREPARRRRSGVTSAGANGVRRPTSGCTRETAVMAVAAGRTDDFCTNTADRQLN